MISQKAIKRLLRPLIPKNVLDSRARQATKREHLQNAGRSTKEIFESIYNERKWGGSDIDTGSGSGSQDLAAQDYIHYINKFLRTHPEIRKIVDIGCGDMRVARNFELRDDQTYLGTDIVAQLVTLNQERYGSDQLTFMQIDAIADSLPKGDLYLVRQVLQHLSNKDALRVCEKVQSGHYALITEHHPAPSRFVTPNIDKPTGSDVRVYDGSGLYLETPPFNLPNVQIVLKTAVPKGIMGAGEYLTTYLVEGVKSK